MNLVYSSLIQSLTNFSVGQVKLEEEQVTLNWYLSMVIFEGKSNCTYLKILLHYSFGCSTSVKKGVCYEKVMLRLSGSLRLRFSVSSSILAIKVLVGSGFSK